MPLVPRFDDDDLQSGQVLRELDEEGREREVQALPGRERCDFCNEPGVVWQYGCDEVVLGETLAFNKGTGEVRPEDHTSVGEWAACEKCKFLVDRSEVKKLADRCARLFREKHPEMAALPLARVRRDLMTLQTNFWRNRRRELDRPFRTGTHGDRRR